MEINLKFQDIVRICSVNISKILRNDLVEQQTTKCSIDDTCNLCSVFCRNSSSYFYLRVESDLLVLICKQCFVLWLEELAFSNIAILLHCQIVDTKDHILWRNGNRSTIWRLQKVIRGQEQESTFCLCLNCKWKVNSHLVTIEIGVERCTYQWMKLDCLTFYKDRLKCLDTQSVKCRSTV